MFIENDIWWVEKNTKTVELKCSNCGNTKENIVKGTYDGVHMGFTFLPKNKRIGKKAYVLSCPICGHFNKQISKEELELLKI